MSYDFLNYYVIIYSLKPNLMLMLEWKIKNMVYLKFSQWNIFLFAVSEPPRRIFDKIMWFSTELFFFNKTLFRASVPCGAECLFCLLSKLWISVVKVVRDYVMCEQPLDVLPVFLPIVFIVVSCFSMTSHPYLTCHNTGATNSHPSTGMEINNKPHSTFKMMIYECNITQ